MRVTARTPLRRARSPPPPFAHSLRATSYLQRPTQTTSSWPRAHPVTLIRRALFRSSLFRGRRAAVAAAAANPRRNARTGGRARAWQDLASLNRDLRHTIIVDNSPSSYIFQVGRAIDVGVVSRRRGSSRAREVQRGRDATRRGRIEPLPRSHVPTLLLPSSSSRYSLRGRGRTPAAAAAPRALGGCLSLSRLSLDSLSIASRTPSRSRRTRSTRRASSTTPMTMSWRRSARVILLSFPRSRKDEGRARGGYALRRSSRRRLLTRRAVTSLSSLRWLSAAHF